MGTWPQAGRVFCRRSWGEEGTGRIIKCKKSAGSPGISQIKNTRNSLLLRSVSGSIIYDINFIFFTSQIQSVLGRAGVSGTLDLVMALHSS